MKKSALIIITLALVLSIGIIFSGSGSKNNPGNGAVQNSEIRDGIQYVTINAQGGYYPRVSEAKAGIPTKLVVKTDGTYDCSLSLIIRSLNFKKILPPAGEEIIDAGTPVAGQKIQGVCSMGMYSFQVQFN